jgi:hypothetical protein
LDRIAARYVKQTAEGRKDAETETETAFLAKFRRVRDDVLRPVMAEVGAQLKAAGFDFQVSPGGNEGAPGVDFHVLIPGRGDSKDTIRFFARKDRDRGWQVLGELELKRSPVELKRFEECGELGHDVAEQLVVDAVEQMFASTVDPPSSEPASAEPASGVAGNTVPESAAARAAGGAAEQAGRSATFSAATSDGDTPIGETIVRPTELDQVVGHRPEQALGSTSPGPSGVGQELEHFSDAFLPPWRDPPETRWARWATVTTTGDTKEVDVSVFGRPALPFRQGPASPAFFEEVESVRAQDAAEHRCLETEDETLALPIVEASQTEPYQTKAGIDTSEPTPMGMRSPTILPALTLEEYAAFAAELALLPGQAANIHKKYGIHGASARRALDEAFAGRFRAQPALRQRWETLVVTYHRDLLNRKGSA